MKKLKNNRFYEFWYSKPKLVTALILLIANLIITVLGSGILAIISEWGFLDALKYCTILGISSDGIWTFGTDVPGPETVVFWFHLVIILIQMVTFSGALIGFATTILDSFFENMEQNKKKLKLSNHFLLLNWNNLGANIVYDLSFLEGRKTVVILAENDRDEILDDINNLFSENNRKIKNLNIFVKQGDPTNTHHLLDVSIENAQSIGILQSDLVEEADNGYELSEKELNVFRLLMSIIHLVDDMNIVVESESELLGKKVDDLFSQHTSKNKISVFSHNVVIGHILGKGLVDKDYVDFYNEILSFEGVEFYGIEPMELNKALEIYNDFVPIINYDDDDNVDEEGKKAADHLYILDEDGFLTKRQVPRKFDRIIPTIERQLSEEVNYFLVGNNDALKYVLEELDNEKKVNNPLLSYQLFDYENIEEAVNLANIATGEVKFLLLCDENKEDNKDANIFINLLAVKLDYKLHNNVEVYVEIENPNNITSIKNMGVAKTIVSNKMISLFMIQLMTHENSRKFYTDILVPNEEEGGVDFEIVSAKKYFDLSTPLEFSCKAELVSTFFKSRNEKNMIIGYKHQDDEKINFLCSDMDKEEKIIIDENTSIVVTIY